MSVLLVVGFCVWCVATFVMFGVGCVFLCVVCCVMYCALGCVIAVYMHSCVLGVLCVILSQLYVLLLV